LATGTATIEPSALTAVASTENSPSPKRDRYSRLLSAFAVTNGPPDSTRSGTWATTVFVVVSMIVNDVP
jgi:hypothetical protein